MQETPRAKLIKIDMENPRMKCEMIDTFRVAIHMAGDLNDARRTCKQKAWEGACYTIKAQEFIYKGGQEQGFEIGICAYPKFPKTETVLISEAKELAIMLIEELNETSALVVSDTFTIWVHRREET